MDEHQTNGMTEFLRREIKEWETIAVGQGYRAKKLRRRWLTIIISVILMGIAVAAVLAIAPWASDEPRTEQEGGTQQESGMETDFDETHDESAESMQEEQTTEPEQPVADPYAYDFSVVPEGATPIVPKNTAIKNHPVNQTDRVIDMQGVMAAACQIPAAKGRISVLIIHTHTGEGYNTEGSLYLEADDEEFARSADGTDGVVAVGAQLAKQLNEAGIGTIHCKTVFDGESNRESYRRAAEAITAFRMAYPSLVCVIDVHRSATVDDAGNIVRSLAVSEGRSTAQTRLLCGMSAELTSKTNLALAMTLGERMNQAFPDSCAAVICKEQVLNQDCAPFCLTLEIGSSGNTPEEAMSAAGIVARALCTLFETT